MPQRRSHFPNSSSSSTPLKQTLSARPTPPSRQSKRLKSSPTTSLKITPKKSQYFEHGSSSDSESESELANEGSGYEDEDASASLISSHPESELDDEEDEYVSEEDASKKRKRGRPKTKTNGKAISIEIKGQELWRPGVKAATAPGEAVYIKLPKAREAGKTPYTDGTIHPNTFLFLKDLRANNDREWLKMHDPDYRQSKKDWDTFVESLTEKIIEKDDTIPELPPKDLTFRIYRDIRFSPDPTPYKTHFSAAWSRTGRKGPYAAYYVQVQPNGSFVGAGVWHPEPAPMALLRKEIDKKSHKIKEVLMAPDMRKEFFGGIGPDEKKAVKAFVGMNTENALKTKPKGYEADNPNIDLLRLRNYTIGHKLKDDEVLGPGGLGRIAQLIGILTPFVTYLNSVIMPDEDASSDEEEEQEDEAEGEEEGEEEDDDNDEA
ncbi:hypothetical protein JMJ35_010391 [Cladonia borealis]|uniref:Uncharacterized protein n=1 Tax=Cladonia borealis TaxID=184061 RepID=A0AA39QTC2_9LECA|nr:hypothetical protein JMJ35_010391 [Cladonia borealis]